MSMELTEQEAIGYAVDIIHSEARGLNKSSSEFALEMLQDKETKSVFVHAAYRIRGKALIANKMPQIEPIDA